jgi:DNA-binding HxlR family transcriptional regulator
LNDLEADHVLARTDYTEVPPRVDYALTPLGRSLADAIVPLCTWKTVRMRGLGALAHILWQRSFQASLDARRHA